MSNQIRDTMQKIAAEARKKDVCRPRNLSLMFIYKTKRGGIVRIFLYAAATLLAWSTKWNFPLPV